MKRVCFLIILIIFFFNNLFAKDSSNIYSLKIEKLGKDEFSLLSKIIRTNIEKEIKSNNIYIYEYNFSNIKENLFVYNEDVLDTFFVYLKNGEFYNLSINVPYKKRKFKFKYNVYEIQKSKNKTIYFASSSKNLNLSIQSKKSYINNENTNENLQLFLSGIFIIMFFYNLFIYFSTKEKYQLYYSLSIIFSLSIWLSNIDWFAKYIVDYNILFKIYLGMFFSSLYGIFLILFTKEFLNINTFWRRYLSFFKKALIFYPILGVFFIENIIYLNAISFITGLLLFLSIFILSVSLLVDRKREIVYFFIGNLGFVLMGVYFFLATMKIVPDIGIAKFSMELGSAFQMVFFSIAIADLINILKQKNEKAQLDIILQLQENNKIKSEINEKLELEVKNRTQFIEFQKVKIEDKHKEITDSIQYAKRIQEAVLPSDERMDFILNNGFIIYQPKDIVAGDFYWIEYKDGYVFLAVADCTGHGVPGAFMSMICSQSLNRAIVQESLRNTNEILDYSKQDILNRLVKNNKDLKDGMDISLIRIDKNSSNIQWSGAYNPLWLIRNKEFIVLDGDKQPIGFFEKSFPFTKHELKLKENDQVYLFTDGFADQFGGEKGKKIKPKNFKELLINTNELNPLDQKSSILSYFNKWKKDQEQVDDVCIISWRR